MAVLLTVELANKLIDHYEKVIRKASRCSSLKSALWLVRYYNVDYGICGCSASIFKCYLSECDYITSKLPEHRRYVYPLPIQSTSTADVIDRLRYRVDILKQFIQHPPVPL